MTKLLTLLTKKKDAAEDDSVLHIDCRRCESQPSISSSDCMKCISSQIGMKEFDEISFISNIETRYRTDASRIICKCTNCVNDAVSELEENSGKCSGCPLSSSMISELIWQDFSENGLATVLNKIEMTRTECQRCSDCIVKCKKSIDKISDKMYDLSKECTVVAFKLVGA